jgi:3-deoxy-D-manno-octulosonate 8-phosphate phosphatase (KDO 8-P phosphatase)
VDNELRAKANNIKMLLLDVDGVLTDGTFQPGVVGGGSETKRFHSRDGIGLVLARKAGLKLGLISGRSSPIVEARARELQLHFVRLGVDDKLVALDEALAQESCELSELAFMGDDLPDLAILTRAGLSATVQDAPLDVRSRVDYVTRARGGYGAVRELVELILSSQGKLDELIRSYLR